MKLPPKTYESAIGQLRATLAALRPGHPIYDETIVPKDQVLKRFQPVFSLAHLDGLTAEEFTPFLYLENNHHWSGLYRKGLGMAEDMPKLRKGLKLLLDEQRAIAERFTDAIKAVPGLGKGIATAILTVSYPDRYGVWNNTSEAALRKLGLWPDFGRGDRPGARYEKVNDALTRVASDLGSDFWTLDVLWWAILDPQRLGTIPAGQTSAMSAGLPRTPGDRFALEAQLESFLVENWDRTELGKDWEIYGTDDDPEAGNQFPTDIGRIDILAKHRREPRWLVIELKRDQTTDQTVGQALRYMGWIKQHLAMPGDMVEALIISHEVDLPAQYALAMVPRVRMMRYEVQFRLYPADKTSGTFE